jgi:hypothetical protein
MRRKGRGWHDATRVASYNPWVSLSWLVTGRTVGGLTLYPQANRLDRERHCASGRRPTPGSRREGKKGQIVVGQLADLAVLSADYLSVPEAEIAGLEAVLTLLGGRPVYGAGDFTGLAPPPPPVLPDWSAGEDLRRVSEARCGVAQGPAHYTRTRSIRLWLRNSVRRARACPRERMGRGRAAREPARSGASSAALAGRLTPRRGGSCDDHQAACDHSPSGDHTTTRLDPCPAGAPRSRDCGAPGPCLPIHNERGHQTPQLRRRAIRGRCPRLDPSGPRGCCCHHYANRRCSPVLEPALVLAGAGILAASRFLQL